MRCGSDERPVDPEILMEKTKMTKDSRQQGGVRFITLGCKVNQYETQGMREIALAGGFQEVREARPDCDFVVINTCTVTSEADRENRYWIRRARREHPQARIVVTGCYAERNREEIAELPEVDLVLANHEKSDLGSHLEAGCALPDIQDREADRMRRRNFTPLSVSGFQGKGRAFVKIQDGCNHSCSFCKVVLVRGRSRSRGLRDILDEVRRLRDAGYREVVFAGIQLGAYGLDFEKPIHVSDVLSGAQEIEGIERLRLSSIEPTDVDTRVIEALRGLSKVCPHLHIPLQSGDNEILRGMNRRYTREFYRDLIARLRAQVPGFALTLDVMAGFPGEDENAFAQSVRLLGEVQPLKCHVFPYSAREGTRAHRLESLSGDLIRSRVRELILLGDRLGRNVRMPFVGQTVRVLVEKKQVRGGLVTGTTANYLKVCFQGGEDRVGHMVDVKLLTLHGDTFLGRPESNLAAACGGPKPEETVYV